MARRLDVYSYVVIADELRARIASGDLKPGNRLPPETELQQRYGVARQTAARAVRLLRDEGLVELRRGQGTFVRERPERTVVVALRRGDRAHTRMPTRQERHQLGLGDGVPVLVVTRAGGGVEVYAGDVTHIGR